MRKIKIQKIIYTLSLFSFCLFFMEMGMINSATAAETSSIDSEMKCAKPGGGSSGGDDITKKKKQVFCFFSLNNEKEFQYVNAEKRMRYQNEETEKWEWESNDDFDARKQMLEDMKNREDVEIVEYYGADHKNQSVKERFKEMMKDKACDSLVLSGHHAEYFTGKQSIGGEDWKLDLDFLEDMSCEDGCEDWFSNVKSLFLMGCNTVKEPLDPGEKSDQIKGCEGSNTTDCKATSVTIKRATDQNKTDKEKREYLSYSIQNTFNQAYSATLDQNTNPLSSRYLKIFRNSSLYGWSESAPGVGALSRFSIPRFIHMVTGLTDEDRPRERDLSKGSGVDEPDVDAQDIVNFLDVMNSQVDYCEEKYFSASQWTKHWDSGTAPTSCFLKDDKDKKKYEGYKSNACGLNQALDKQQASIAEKQEAAQEVKTAVKAILDSGPEGIKRNFNHLMNVVVQNEGKIPPALHDEVKKALQGSDELRDVLVYNLAKDSNIGFTKKADYMYFYKQVYGDSQGEESKKRHQKVSDDFLAHLNQTYDQVFSLIDSAPESRDMDSVNKYRLVREYHALVQNSVANNGDELANWLYVHQKKEEGQENQFDELIKKYKNPNLEKYLGNDILPEDRDLYSVLFNGLCYNLKESSPEVCKKEETESLTPISSVISTLPILSN